MKEQYDYLIVGAGLYGSVFAREMSKRNRKCLVIDKRDHIGGNCYSEKISGIDVCRYGGHIFHTDNEKVWNYVNSLVRLRSYRHTVMANYKGELYNLPFNMNLFYKMWGVKTPEEAMAKIESQRFNGEPKNFSEQARAIVGEEIFEKLLRGYTEKQWGKKCEDIPGYIAKRLPLRFTFDNDYYSHPFQGLPPNGYTEIFERLLDGIEVRLNIDFFSDRENIESLARNMVFTGRIDEFFRFKLGKLEYRSLRHKIEELPVPNFLGCATMNFTDFETPYTRIIEFKHFGGWHDTPTTVITTEYPEDFDETKIPYYPINDEKNNALYLKYLEEAKRTPNVIFGGRLGEYRYYDMDKVIESALKKVDEVIGKEK